ncbi:MAG: penicillin acylase family protein, partial [Deltaproteobacteria bacterium]|nr:penicillin acylase family protein [Deltaproteobacteria bacterium]
MCSFLRFFSVALVLAFVGTLLLSVSACPSSPSPGDGGSSDAHNDSAPSPQGTCLGDIRASESLHLSGLDEQVEVVYDDRGIPHIYGKTIHDVIMAQGYLMARDRYGQMEFIRRSVLGRLAEVAGHLEPGLIERDFESRVMGYARMGKAIYDSLPQNSLSKRVADAFAQGVNAYIQAVDEERENPVVPGADVVTLLLYRHLDRRWHGADIFAMARFQAAALSFDAADDVRRTLLLQAVRERFRNPDPRAGLWHDILGFWPARAVYTRHCPAPPCWNDGHTTGWSRPSHPITSPMTIPPKATLLGAISFLDRIEPRFDILGMGDHHRGSNNWVISPSLTANHKTLLANDPHLALVSPPVWWYVHLNTAKMDGEEAIDVEGVAFAGLPGVVLGFN